MEIGNVVMWVKPLQDGTLSLSRAWIGKKWPRVGDLDLVEHVTGQGNAKLVGGNSWTWPSTHLEVLEQVL